MSIMYCNFCDHHFDTDFNAEHFDAENKTFECVAEEEAFEELP